MRVTHACGCVHVRQGNIHEDKCTSNMYQDVIDWLGRLVGPVGTLAGIYMKANAQATRMKM